MRNLKTDGTSRLGRPTGPSPGRGSRPWDEFDEGIIWLVAANPDVERYKIAEYIGISPAKLSTITCSPRGAALLADLLRDPPAELRQLRLT